MLSSARERKERIALESAGHAERFWIDYLLDMDLISLAVYDKKRREILKVATDNFYERQEEAHEAEFRPEDKDYQYGDDLIDLGEAG